MWFHVYPFITLHVSVWRIDSGYIRRVISRFNTLPAPPGKNMTRMRCKGPYKVAIYFIKSIKYCKISQRNGYTLIGTTFGSFLVNEHQSIFDIQPCKQEKLEAYIQERLGPVFRKRPVPFYFWPYRHHVHMLFVSKLIIRFLGVLEHSEFSFFTLYSQYYMVLNVCHCLSSIFERCLWS